VLSSQGTVSLTLRCQVRESVPGKKHYIENMYNSIVGRDNFEVDTCVKCFDLTNLNMKLEE
jgi:hypothetical protein